MFSCTVICFVTGTRLISLFTGLQSPLPWYETEDGGLTADTVIKGRGITVSRQITTDLVAALSWPHCPCEWAVPSDSLHLFHPPSADFWAHSSAQKALWNRQGQRIKEVWMVTVTEKRWRLLSNVSEKILYNRSFEELVGLRVKDTERSQVCTLIF